MKITCAWMYAIGEYGFPPKPEHMLKAIKEMADMGFEYIELEGMGYENLDQLISIKGDLKKAIEDNGISLSNFAPLIPEVFSMDKPIQKKALDYFIKGMEVADYLGSPRIWIDSYAPPVIIKEGKTFSEEISYGNTMLIKIPKDFSWDRFWDHFVASVDIMNRQAKKANLEFLIEPRVHEVTPNSDSLLRLFDQVHSENLGAILDVAHQHAQKEPIPLAIEKLGKRIRYVHVADNDGRDNRHFVPGDGNVDWDEVFETLIKIGYQGHYAIDLEKLPDHKGSFLKTRDFLMEKAKLFNI